MKFHILILAFVLFVACTTAKKHHHHKKSVGKTAPKDVEKPNISVFSKKLSRSIALGVAKDKKKTLCSPLNAYAVLSLVASGANGNTADQINNLLGLSGDAKANQETVKNLIDDLNKEKNVKIEVSNSVYVAKKVDVNADFKNQASISHIEVGSLNVDNSSDAAEAVNKKISEATHQKVTDIVNSTVINSDSSVILLNAVYIKGQWAQAFDKWLTTDKWFSYLKDGKEKKIWTSTMFTSGEYFHGYLSRPQAEFIELPYLDSDLSMIIVVPSILGQFDKLIESLDDSHSRIKKAGTVKSVSVRIPKFKIESTVDIQTDLEKLGLTDVFSSSADLKGIGKEALKVDKLRQKIVVVEVDEDGKKEEIDSIAELDILDLYTEKEEFQANKQFYFEIRSKKNNVALVSGVVSRPFKK